MALIHCPECSAEVSDKAENCPKCAYPLNKETPLIKYKTAPKEGLFLQSLNFGCMLILGLVLLVIVLGVFGAIFE